ncbi:uncharacterized protein EV422DRAFT_373989 [Fimicolochytrium jonesii]|uniref:uncharacterized protein n=1 Tax=Fimicolochytrium jonesii TaxID=1396493 RepID=UPI0022FE52DE|nr:uncharacterized protein EV422DRAFT_373989 [Fimicolochytrium jonesii]KAI8815521.1 hypothetical protein EV422DRAFT_373989 [Fimicolochytrium jonesii]
MSPHAAANTLTDPSTSTTTSPKSPSPSPSPSPPPLFPLRLSTLTLSTLRPHLTPKNIFLSVLLLIIVVTGAILFMCLVGMIRFDDKARKDAWVEVTSQILNACFCVNAGMLAPGRARDAWLAGRWVLKNDIKAARQLEQRQSPWLIILPPSSCIATLDLDTSAPLHLTTIDTPSSKPPPPLPRKIWLSILSLQALNVLFQIPMAAAMWIWASDHSARPAWLVAVSLVASFACGAVGGLWPLWIVKTRTRTKGKGGGEKKGEKEGDASGVRLLRDSEKGEVEVEAVAMKKREEQA